MTKKKTGLIFFPAFDWSLGAKHPEREERLLYTMDHLIEEGLFDQGNFLEIAPKLATKDTLAQTHFYVPSIEKQVHPANLVAAGAGLTLADLWHKGEIDKGFALVRPPGHHAMNVIHGNRGFCSTNNAAVLVDYLRSNFGYKKIAIVDSDVHHGDGTQDIFFHDPDVLFISFHQDGRTLFPGTGFPNELGGPRAFGKTINIPLPPGTGDEGLSLIMNTLILPLLADFGPEVIINSAGQDNHFSDPLGSLRVTSRGYGDFTRALNPDLVLLEGGYAIESALPYVNMSVLLALGGDDYLHIREPGYSRDLEKDSGLVIRDIKETIISIKNNLSNPKRVKSEFTRNRDTWVRHKKIFYDTHYFYEGQRETLYGCDHCPGILEIWSEAQHEDGHEYLLQAFTMFPATCPKCRALGLELYKNAERNTQPKRLIKLINKDW